MGPNINTGKKDNALRTIISINKNTPNVPESIRKLPFDKGIYFFCCNKSAIIMAPIIGINLPHNIANAVVTFQNTVLSPKASKPEPLPATEETYSYIIVVKPCDLLFVSQFNSLFPPG